MNKKICEKGHAFERSSSCPVCPLCSKEEIDKSYDSAFPKIGAPAFRAIHSIGISTIEDLTKYTEQQLLDLHGFGPKALRLLKVELQKKGLSFAKK